MKFQNIIQPANLAKTSLIATTFVLALSSPAGALSTSASLSTASAQATLDKLKTSITSAIDTSITKLQDSASSINLSLNVNANSSGISSTATAGGSTATGSVSSSGASGSVSTSSGATASGSVSSSGASASASTSGGSTSATTDTSTPSLKFDSTDFLESILSIPKTLIQKLQQSNQKAVQKLTDLKTQVEKTADVTDLQAQAKQYDQEFKDIATSTIQASVTKSIADQTQVLDQLQTAASALQSQVSQLKTCLQSVSASATGSASSTSVSGSINASAPGCTDLNVDANSGDNGQSLQDQIDEIKSSLQTVRSFLTSSISLVSQLKDGNYSGTITSFSGISSQLDVVANLSSNVQNDLINLSAAVNK
jgi:hypothetical protein